MKRQATTTLILCGTLLSMAIGCSQGEDSELAGGATVNCEQQASVTLTDSALNLVSPFGPDVGYTALASTASNVSSGTDSSGLCLDKNKARMNQEGFLVDDSGTVRTDPKTGNKLPAAGGGCHYTLNGEVTGLGQRADALQDTYAQNARNASTTFGKSPNHKCTTTNTDARTLEQKVAPSIPSKAEGTRGMNPGELASVPGSAGPAAANPGGAPSTADISSLMTAAKTGQSTGPATSSPRPSTSPTESGGTGGGLESPDSKIATGNTGFSGNGNTSFGLTAPK
jgi:hypothetical protein